ncbi:VanZ family protein [Geobacillus sp. FSL K6-3411]|uniref:VanZ family protein n=1 Tax=Geobacillus TaxID=129337 RepID=UPI0030D6E906
MKNRWMTWAVVLVRCGIIYYFTESPLFTGANTANWIREMIKQLSFFHVTTSDDSVWSWNYFVRKFAHMPVFGLLAIIVWRALYPRRWAMVGAWVFTVIYACLDEWHRSFHPERTPLLSDVVIDAIGATLALWIVWMSMRKVRQSYEQSVR